MLYSLYSVGAYIADAQSISENFSSCRFHHIHREGNRVAHLLTLEGFDGGKGFSGLRRSILVWNRWWVDPPD
ncbi:hypothetical protein PVK06_043312 [Gossypium arboreum]|uniref:RNase H type-1 domain-containing protein n=1 Tax=Gossypium arboreum TaxID=29729 RepID=A0ABR0MN62_GOSAR|nr:hypothetical protein PVK06_043312 [Gossypium arboreum]